MNKDTWLAYNRAWKQRQKLELAIARHEKGLCPRSGLDPVAFLNELRADVARRDAEYQALRAAEKAAS